MNFEPILKGSYVMVITALNFSRHIYSTPTVLMTYL